MKLDRRSLTLYAVTDSGALKGYTLEQAVDMALEGGATFLQLREKDMNTDELTALAKKIKPIAAKYNVPFVIDDDVAAAKKSGADGVHIGQNDMPVSEARNILGSGKIIGVTARSLAQALSAEAEGADYIGIGALFATSTKTDTVPMSAETAKAITSAVRIPVVGIAGINKSNIRTLKGYGLDGAAVVSAIFAAENPKTAARELRLIAKTEKLFD